MSGKNWCDITLLCDITSFTLISPPSLDDDAGRCGMSLVTVIVFDAGSCCVSLVTVIGVFDTGC